MTPPLLPLWPPTCKRNDSLDFASCGGTLHELHDGHVPELFHEHSQYVSYPSEEPASVLVQDNALPTSLVDALYEMTVSKEEPWGTYVTMKQVQDFWASNRNPKTTSQEECARAAVAHFLDAMKRGANGGATTTIPCHASSRVLSSCDNIHGVAVWALASQKQPVCYHVDHAELIRFEHNIVVTPLFAGTLQCTRPLLLKGGQFAVNIQGMEHYVRHGYKGIKSGDNMGGWKCPCDLEKVHYSHETQWVTIPYKYNRMIGHSGHLPHLSAPFTVCNDISHRVILGFNVFRTDVGPTVMMAPEHSDAFCRRIKWHRAFAKHSSLSLSNIREYKALTKLLVLAKREKQRQEFRQLQELLDADIEAILHQHTSMQVKAFMSKCGKPNGEWPSAMDVQVHLQRRVNQGKLRVITSGSNINDDTRRLTLESTIQLHPTTSS